MRKYLYMTRLTMMTALQYKAFFVATFLSLAVKILVALYVWKTIFFTQPEVNGFTLQTFTTYIIFANLLASLNSFSLGEDLSYSIIQGSIAGEFLRPYSFIVALFFKDLGHKLLELFKFFLVFIGILLVHQDFYLPDGGNHSHFPAQFHPRDVYRPALGYGLWLFGLFHGQCLGRHALENRPLQSSFRRSLAPQFLSRRCGKDFEIFAL